VRRLLGSFLGIFRMLARGSVEVKVVEGGGLDVGCGRGSFVEKVGFGGGGRGGDRREDIGEKADRGRFQR